MKRVQIKKRGKRKQVEYKPDNEEAIVDITNVRMLDQQYIHHDQFTKQQIRK